MKHLKSIITILILSLTLFSCSTDDNEDNNNATYIKATIDGEAWESNTVENSSFSSSVSQNIMRYDLQANDENFKISISVADETQALDCLENRSYLDTQNEIFFNLFYGLGEDTFVSIHNTDNDNGNFVVRITNCDEDKISGTFSGTMYKNGNYEGLEDTPEELIIENGEFRNVSMARFIFD